MSEIQVHQCLYGYQDGHRLLSSSLRLPQEAASTLLLLSDLAPGLSLPVGTGYWTGIPLQSVKSYALMHTWLAPEMSRPGCVWTHVLIVSFADMARFTDLSVLMDQMVRPNSSHGYEGYTSSLSLASSIGLSNTLSSTQLNPENVQQIIRSLYSESGKGRLVAPLGELDSIIFALWSQQWPRLRRKFSFRTAVSSAEATPSKKEFDISVSLSSDSQRNLNIIETEMAEPWEQVAVEDILKPHATDFRRFLWRYGSDLRMGHRRFKFLAQLYLATRSKKVIVEDSRHLLEDIMIVLPNPDEGKMLKSDLLGTNKYSLLPVLDPIYTLAFYINEPWANGLPPLADEVFEAIPEQWNTRSEEILSIAEVAAQRETEQGARLLKSLASVTNSTTFLSSTKNKPNLRRVFLASTPSLLDSDELVKVDRDELFEFLTYVPDNNIALAERLLSRLLLVDDARVALDMISRFPNPSIAAIVAAIEAASIGKAAGVPNAWVFALSKQKAALLEGGVIEQAQTTSALSLYASMLGYSSSEVLSVGPGPWTKGVRNARDNLVGNERKKFLCFLLELALHRPVAGSETLFELSFESTHEDLRYSNLGYELTYELLRFLPSLGWFSNWDNCLRLRAGVIEAYINGNLDIRSFKRLGSHKLYEQLLSAVGEVKNGSGFLKRL